MTTPRFASVNPNSAFLAMLLASSLDPATKKIYSCVRKVRPISSIPFHQKFPLPSSALRTCFSRRGVEAHKENSLLKKGDSGTLLSKIIYIWELHTEKTTA